VTKYVLENEDFADGIYNILKAVDWRLGGGYDVSTGIDYKNDVFETHSYWAHCDTCTCGFEDWSWQIDAQVMERMKQYPGGESESPDSEWWRLYDMEYGNVTQGEERSHADDCELNLPGFYHHSSGLKVEWYKRVGRSTKSNQSMKPLDWYQIVIECLEAIREDDIWEHYHKSMAGDE